VLKQIPITDLTVDMYISEIIETAGVSMPKKKKGMIRDIRIISKFIEIGIQQIIIDIEKGIDVASLADTENDTLTNTDLLYSKEIEENLKVLNKNMSTQHHELELEWTNAKAIFKASVNILHESMQALKNNEKINPEYFHQASKAILRSIMRNKDALTWLGKDRDQQSYLYEHSVNSSILMGLFAHAHGLSNENIEFCITGALLHDLGQVHIEEEFFQRSGPLTPQEFEQVKEHVNFGLRILADDDNSSDIILHIVLEHHERVDGSGYPNGLKKDEISLYGRMFAIVDTYDAVTNNRHHKKALPSSVGMRTLLQLSKKHFDQGLVHQFIKCMGIYPTGSLVKLSNGYLAIVIAQNAQSPLKPLVNVMFNTKNNAYINPEMRNLIHDNMENVKITNYEDPANFEIDVNEFMPEEMEA
jgi:HD-GYP domain-containing protein (c-di-GMP phosphodiesterase class II)